MSRSRGGWPGLLALLVPMVLAAQTESLELTLEVLGREDRIDERIVNRIEIPGLRTEPMRDVAGTLGGVAGGVGETLQGVTDGIVAPVLPLLRYEEWVEQRREAGRDRDRGTR